MELARQSSGDVESRKVNARGVSAILEVLQKRISGMLLLPWLVSAPFELHVLKMRDESPQQIARGGTGMRVNMAVKHEHGT
jgi:hypothetical protein